MKAASSWEVAFGSGTQLKVKLGRESSAGQLCLSWLWNSHYKPIVVPFCRQTKVQKVKADVSGLKSQSQAPELFGGLHTAVCVTES